MSNVWVYIMYDTISYIFLNMSKPSSIMYDHISYIFLCFFIVSTL
jgi:hypothetical protein